MSGGNYFEFIRRTGKSYSDKEIVYLDSIITGENTPTRRCSKDAQEQKIQIVKNMENELTLRTVMAEGF